MTSDSLASLAAVFALNVAASDKLIASSTLPMASTVSDFISDIALLVLVSRA